jgi:hypothetical protein
LHDPITESTEVGIICKHGQLKRQCLICEQREEIADLESQLHQAIAQRDEAQGCLDAARKAITRIADELGQDEVASLLWHKAGGMKPEEIYGPTAAGAGEGKES